MYHVYQDISGGHEAKDWDDVLQKILALKVQPQTVLYGTVLQKINDMVILGEENGFSKTLFDRLYSEDK